MTSTNTDLFTDEEYLIYRAKQALKTDPHEAKAWMITAKTLFPNNFGIQFEAYLIEKSSRNVKEAAKCFGSTFEKFPSELDLYNELHFITTALREENVTDPDKKLLIDIFENIPLEIQHMCLVAASERTEDISEHCRLSLLLLRRFPHTVPHIGPKLIDNLFTVEKHSHYQTPVNCYRKLLVVDLVPLIANNPIDLPHNQLMKLVYKSIQFYQASTLPPTSPLAIDPFNQTEIKIDDPWGKLFQIMEQLSPKLGWHLGTTFSKPWNCEIYSQTLCQATMGTGPLPDEHPLVKQIVYFCTVCLLRTLHDYQQILAPQEMILVEIFDMTSTDDTLESLVKRSRHDPVLIASFGGLVPQTPFLSATALWEALHSSPAFLREFQKLTSQLRMDATPLPSFLADINLYRGMFDQAIAHHSTISDLRNHLQLAGIYISKGIYSSMLDQIVLAIKLMSFGGSSNVNNRLIMPKFKRAGYQRCLNFIPSSPYHALCYCARLVLYILQISMERSFNGANDPSTEDLILGHILVLLQLEWPSNWAESLADRILHRIGSRRNAGRSTTFAYPPFRPYLVNVDLLEEIAFLTSQQVHLELSTGTSHSSQRRIATRGVDRSAKEDIKTALRQQVARHAAEPIETLISRFIINERDLIETALPT